MAKSADRDYELWVLLHQARDAVFRVRENELASVGLTAMQAAVLFIIKSIEGPAVPAEIARWIFREHHTVSGLLNRMEKEGLVKKTKGRPQRNMITVEITEKGEQAYTRSRELKSVHRIMSGLSAGDKTSLRRCLQTTRNRALIAFNESKKTDAFPFP